jgi:hypothetical protein
MLDSNAVGTDNRLRTIECEVFAMLCLPYRGAGQFAASVVLMEGSIERQRRPPGSSGIGSADKGACRHEKLSDRLVSRRHEKVSDELMLPVSESLMWRR